jgi:hypothetical protein
VIRDHVIDLLARILVTIPVTHYYCVTETPDLKQRLCLEKNTRYNNKCSPSFINNAKDGWRLQRK